MALTKIGATLGGSADVIQVTQNSHGLTLGYPVKMTASGYAHATADSAANAEVVGIIIATTTNTLTIALGGRITVDGCVPNVTAGTVLFLQVSAGLLAATEPSSAGQISKPMAVVTVANSEMIMVQQRGEVISTGAATIADDAVTTAKILNANVTTAKIADANVTLAKIANQAANTVLVRDANSSGVVSAKAVADTQILIGDGTGFTAAALSGDVTMANTGAVTIATDAVDIAMLSATGTASSSTFLRGDNAWAAAGGGALTFVGKATASNSSTLGITGIDGTYENYLILGSDLVPASDHRQFQLQFGDSSGIDTGASDYEYHLQEIGSSTTGYSGRVEDNAVFIELGNKVGNASGEGLGFALWLNMPGNGTMFATVHGTHVEWTKDGALVGGTVVGARKTTVISLTQIQLKLNAGNIATGELTVYGVKNA